MKILIIRLSGMREILLTTPLIRCLHQQLPEAELHYLVNHEYKEVISSNPYIQHLHDLQFNRETQIAALKKEGFNHILDLQKDAASKYLVAAIGVHETTAKKKSFIQSIFKTFRDIATPKPTPEKQYFESVAPLVVKNDDGGLQFFIPKEATITYKDIPASHGAGYVALAVGDRDLPEAAIEKLKALCAAIDHPIVIVGTQNEAAMGEEMRNGEAVKVYNACGKFSSYECADLLQKAKLVITLEIGWLYAAAALKKEMIVLAENTAGSKEWTALYNKAFLKQLEVPPFDVVPFYKKGVDASAVLPLVKARLKRKP